jgi:nucleotide-binding universal stress UspA family protein
MPIKISKILCPTDYSDLSSHSLLYAREFAATFDAQVHCVHVIDESCQYWAAMGPESIPIAPAVEDLMGYAETHMQRFADEHLVGFKYKPITKVITGSPWAEIVQYAHEYTIDMIIIATHGRGGFAHALLGSTAERVVRKAPCPVLSVHEQEHEFVQP